MDEHTKERRETHIRNLQQMRRTMLESENWENLKPWIEAVTAGGMALQRLNKEDFGEDKDT